MNGQEAISQILQHFQISVPDAVIGLDARTEMLGNLVWLRPSCGRWQWSHNTCVLGGKLHGGEACHVW